MSLVILFKQISTTRHSGVMWLAQVNTFYSSARARREQRSPSGPLWSLTHFLVWQFHKTWKGFLQREFSSRTEGYFHLQAVALFEPGFLYIIFARSKFDVRGTMQPFTNFSRKVDRGKCPGLMAGLFVCDFLCSSPRQISPVFLGKTNQLL